MRLHAAAQLFDLDPFILGGAWDAADNTYCLSVLWGPRTAICVMSAENVHITKAPLEALNPG